MSSLGGWINAHWSSFSSIQSKYNKENQPPKPNLITTNSKKSTLKMNIKTNEAKTLLSTKGIPKRLNIPRQREENEPSNTAKIAANTNNVLKKEIILSSLQKEQNTKEKILSVQKKETKKVKIPKRSRGGVLHLHCQHWASSKESVITSEMAALKTKERIKEARKENKKKEEKTQKGNKMDQRRALDHKSINIFTEKAVCFPSSNLCNKKTARQQIDQIKNRPKKENQVAMEDEEQTQGHKKRDEDLRTEENSIKCLDKDTLPFSRLAVKAADTSLSTGGVVFTEIETAATSEATSTATSSATIEVKVRETEPLAFTRSDDIVVEGMYQPQRMHSDAASKLELGAKEARSMTTNSSSRPLNYTAKLRSNLYCRKKSEAAEKKRSSEEQRKEKLQELFRRSKEQVAKAAGYTLARGSYKLSEYNKEKSRGLFSQNWKQEHMYIVKQHADLMWKSQFVNG